MVLPEKVYALLLPSIFDFFDRYRPKDAHVMRRSDMERGESNGKRKKVGRFDALGKT